MTDAEVGPLEPDDLTSAHAGVGGEVQRRVEPLASGGAPGYRYAERVGDQLFVAGQVPHDKHGNLVGPDQPAVQASQCLDNLELLLEAHAFNVTDMRQLTIYVVGDGNALSNRMGRRRSMVNHDAPPATLLGVPRLGYRDQLVEIDATVIGQ